MLWTLIRQTQWRSRVPSSVVAFDATTGRHRWSWVLPMDSGSFACDSQGCIVNLLATRVPLLRAAVPFYGAPAPLDGVPAMKGELLVQMAGNDTRINGLWPTYETALKAAGIKYEAHIYPGVEHGFNNNTTPRFDKVAAALAWARTLALFKRTLT
jgi:acetyl esterase/lipase